MVKKRWAAVIIALLLILLVLWIFWANKALEVTEYELKNEKIPDSFSGFRIAQISDLHNDTFGENNSKLLDLLRNTEPDIIVITGDLVDSRRTDYSVGLDFAQRALEIAPVYYVAGNHESRLAEHDTFQQELKTAGITVLDNRKVILTRNDQTISLLGVYDPHFFDDWEPGNENQIIYMAVSQIQDPSDGYTVLLSHRPDLLDAYEKAGVDLVFSGHAHGGQFRIPIIGGLYGPDEGWFPKFDAGRLEKGNTTLIISRGLGASVIPLRFNNRPEIVVATLRHG